MQRLTTHKHNCYNLLTILHVISFNPQNLGTEGFGNGRSFAQVQPHLETNRHRGSVTNAVNKACNTLALLKEAL